LENDGFIGIRIDSPPWVFPTGHHYSKSVIASSRAQNDRLD
jgi:hypothetical protein